MPAGLVIEENDGITEYRFSDSSEEAIDMWGEHLSRLIASTPVNDCFYVLMDVSDKQVSFSSHARATSKAIFTQYREHSGRYAFLFSSPTAPYYSRIFFASLGRLNFELAYFSNRAKALAWLREK